MNRFSLCCKYTMSKTLRTLLYLLYIIIACSDCWSVSFSYENWSFYYLEIILKEYLGKYFHSFIQQMWYMFSSCSLYILHEIISLYNKIEKL